MVCPNCGTLNDRGREACFQCSQALTDAHLRSVTHCAVHPARAVLAYCGVCGVGLCEDCLRAVGGVAYCDACRDVLDRPGAETKAVLNPLELSRLSPASPALRFMSGAIDFALVASGAVVLALLFWMLTGSPPGSPWQPGANAAYWLLTFAGTAAYFIYSVAAEGQTPGYAQTNLIVVRPDGSQADLRAAAVRFLVGVVSALCLMAGFAWILIDPGRRAWHDRLSDTIVVSLEERGV